MTTLTKYVMSDDVALGFFDADGSILLTTDFRIYPSGKKAISYRVTYEINQSLSKTDLVLKFSDKFNVQSGVNFKTAKFRFSYNSKVGKMFRQFLTKNLPKHPYRRRDWLISEEVIPLLMKTSSKIVQLTIACLIKEKSYFLTQGGGEQFFTKCCEHLLATSKDIAEAKATAKPLIDKINRTMDAFYQTLPTLPLTDDYVLGVHFGDGSFYVALSWKPITSKDGTKKPRLRCEPEWSISGDDEVYAQAFVNRFNGRIVNVDQAGQKKFALTGQKKCVTILPLFESAPWMPTYKKEQFDRWKEALVLLNRQEHFTEEGLKKLLDLTYGLAEKGGRKWSKEQYLDWGIAWLNDQNRQKRQPRSEERLNQ